MTEEYFRYGEREMAYLKSRDRRLGEVIDLLGFVPRPVIPNIFSALVNSVVGQQISTKAHQTIWKRMTDALGSVTPESLLTIDEDALQKFGITFRKAGYIRSIAEKAASGELDIGALNAMSEAEVCRTLSSLDGVGVWTSMQRPDVLSFGDLAILRGMRMLYHHRKITRELFEKYRRRYSPCGSVASIYLWAISAGKAGEMRDYAPKTKPRK